MEINMEFKYFVSFPIFCCRYFFCLFYISLFFKDSRLMLSEKITEKRRYPHCLTDCSLINILAECRRVAGTRSLPPDCLG